MTRLYPRRCWLLLLAGLAGPLSAHATHHLGGHISYTALGNNQYRVRVEEYFDPASPASAARNVELVCKKNDCTSTAAGSLVAQLYLQPAAAVPPTCGGTAPYQFLVGEVTVTLPAAQWTLSVDNTNRQSGIANVAQSEMRSMYLQTVLDNTGGQANSSPRFAELELPIVPLNAAHRYSFAAYDADGDSLRYSLAAARWSLVTTPTGGTTVYPCPLDMQYLGYPAGTATDAASGQTGSYPAGQFSATFPLPSFRVSNGAATPWAALNPATGLLQLAPAQPGRYAVVVRVDEYRRLNGTAVLLGSTWREVTYFAQASPNLNPTLTATSNNAPVDFDQALTVSPGQVLSLTFAATDPDAGQAVRLSSNVASQLPGATFQPNLVTPTAQLSWTVPGTAAGGQYAFTVRATDNACPLNGSDTRTVLLRVSGRRPNATTGGRAARLLSAFPTPFTQQVTFQLLEPKAQPVLITDGLGRLVARLHSAADGRVSWQPQALPAGLYFARTPDGQQTVRLVKAE
ncbi:hypothetical protein EJV47_11740 [Hymenobacter gummosus]|uniref:T9SS type A sorting domain-containing protein n=1 Tax=Hymenobacter gummosus TaxID=1776032 RepID=A0A3S0JEU1_9BACT|nr:hypothetical protein [Hymenobacter gummosus]RTQ50290.1 hypothetical protein EJV47_11740 [Hymenobacter gummosus]